jgi:hypothetical protein
MNQLFDRRRGLPPPVDFRLRFATTGRLANDYRTSHSQQPATTFSARCSNMSVCPRSGRRGYCSGLLPPCVASPRAVSMSTAPSS